MTHKDANPEICHCMKVTYRDVEDAINSSEKLTDVTEEFKEVQEKTQCTTGCGGWFYRIFFANSTNMKKLVKKREKNITPYYKGVLLFFYLIKNKIITPTISF